MQTNFTPTVLTIAGSDPYGGAGLQVDSKVIHALGGYALSITTALTAQSSTGVKEVLPTPIEHFRIQLHTILEDIEVDAVKIGMLANAEIIEVVAEAIVTYKLKNIVLDTVLVSSSGKVLLESSAIKIMMEKLFPSVDIITPNIPEVNALLKSSYLGESSEIESMSERLLDLGVKAVLLKGGHSTDKSNATDYLVVSHMPILSFSTTRLHTTHTHGTGCVLSSAIAIHLAKGLTLEKSVEKAKDFLYQKLHTSSSLRFKYKEIDVERKEPLL